MTSKIRMDAVFEQSDDIVARTIEDEFIIIPITSGVGDLEGELYTLNETGKAIWDRIDSKKTVSGIIQSLLEEYESGDQVEQDTIGLLTELVSRKIIIEIR